MRIMIQGRVETQAYYRASGTRKDVYPRGVLTESGKYFNGICIRIQQSAATDG